MIIYEKIKKKGPVFIFYEKEEIAKLLEIKRNVSLFVFLFLLSKYETKPRKKERTNETVYTDLCQTASEYSVTLYLYHCTRRQQEAVPSRVYILSIHVDIYRVCFGMMCTYCFRHWILFMP